MAEENESLEDIKKLLSGEGAGLDSNLTLLALLEVQKSIGKTEANVATLLRTVEGQGKRLLRVEIALAFAAGGIGLLIYLLNLLGRNIAAIHALLASSH